MVDLFGALSLLVVDTWYHVVLVGAAKIENWLVIGKIAVIILFIVVGATAIQLQNWLPFVPKHVPGTNFGGVHGIFMGAACKSSSLTSDSIRLPLTQLKLRMQRTMPRAIIGTLLIATVLFVGVAGVLTGMYKYIKYANNAEPCCLGIA